MAYARWYIIEHPARGVFVELDYMDNPPKPRFRWSIPRDEGHLFGSKEAAQKELDKFPPKIKAKSYIHGPIHQRLVPRRKL